MSTMSKLGIIAVYRPGANPRGRSWLRPSHLRRGRFGLQARQEWPKECGCGRAWSRSAWASLLRVGVFDLGSDRLELRQCACLSTIAVPLS